MRKGLLIILALAVLLLSGCGSDSPSSTESWAPFSIPVKKPPHRYEKTLHTNAAGLMGPELKPIMPHGPPPGFLYEVQPIEGIGVFANPGSRLTVQYVGVEYGTGRKFASSWDEGKPFTFTLGDGEAIQGWEEALENGEVGDRTELVIPPELTKGPFPHNVPKDKTAIFVIELLRSESAQEVEEREAKSKSAKATTKKSKPIVKVPAGAPPKELVVKDLEEGRGPAAKSGDEVTVHYVGVDYKTGKQFDASWDRGEPFSFTLGSGEVIKGWDQGIEGMKAGGRRELVIPPALAYGSQQVGSIAANSTLVFVVDLLEIN
jgi:peptidylprolyl isomerase